jgi:hypothetical protein
MAHYRFEDESGRKWSAWEVHLSDAANVHPGLREGWIAFESGDEKRRLAPIPAEWESATEDMVRRWCREADVVHKKH